MPSLPENIVKSAVERIAGARPASCPPDEQVLGFYSGSLSEAEEEAMREHLAVCASCVELGRDVRGFLDAIGEGSPDASPKPFVSAWRWRAWAAAAALLLTAGVGLYLARDRRDGPWGTSSRTSRARGRSPCSGSRSKLA
jgi:hypothetical protein